MQSKNHISERYHSAPYNKTCLQTVKIRYQGGAESSDERGCCEIFPFSPPRAPSPLTIFTKEKHDKVTSNKATRRKDAIRPSHCYPRSTSWYPFYLKESQLLHKRHYSCPHKLPSPWWFQTLEEHREMEANHMWKWKNYQKLHWRTTTCSQKNRV